MVDADQQVVTVPSSFRARVLGALVLLAAGGITGAVAWFLPPLLGLHRQLGMPGLFVLAGLALVVRAIVLGRQPALILDAEGIRDRRNRLLVAWDDAGLIWLGDAKLQRWWLMGPDLVVVTPAALSFAERTQLEPERKLARVIETRLRVRDLAPLFATLATCPVRIGTAKEWKALTKGSTSS